MTEPKNVLIRLCLPLAHVEAGNRLAYIIDPGPRGDETFGVPCSVSGIAPATHVMCSTWVRADYADILRTRDPGAYMAALSALAEERGRPEPVQADVEVFCANVLIDEEVTPLPIRQDEGAAGA